MLLKLRTATALVVAVMLMTVSFSSAIATGDYDYHKTDLAVSLDCVPGPKGVENRIQMTVNYKTYHEQTLVQKIWIDGESRIDSTIDVQGEGQEVTTKFVGRGNHLVKGVIKLGHKTVKVYDTLYCDSVDPTIDVGLTCVEGPKGVANRIQLDVAYNTRHVPSPLLSRVRMYIDGDLRVDDVSYVEGKGQLTYTKFAGLNDHKVRGFVRVGPLRVNYYKVITCEPAVQPKARILQPCGDPVGGAVFDNRDSAPWRPVTFSLQVKEPGSDSWTVLYKQTVAGKSYVVTPAFTFPPNGKVRVVRGNGDVLAQETVAEAGNYGWSTNECRILSAGELLSH